MDELEEVGSSDDSVVVLVQNREYPEVDEFEVTVGCVLYEVAELPQPKGLRKPKEMKEPLQQFTIDLKFVLVDDIFSGDFQFIDELIVANRSHPFFKRLSEQLLIDLEFFGMVDRPLGFHALQFLVLFFEEQGQLLRVVSFLRPGSLKLLVVSALTVPA